MCFAGYRSQYRWTNRSNGTGISTVEGLFRLFHPFLVVKPQFGLYEVSRLRSTHVIQSYGFTFQGVSFQLKGPLAPRYFLLWTTPGQVRLKGLVRGFSVKYYRLFGTGSKRERTVTR